MTYIYRNGFWSKGLLTVLGFLVIASCVITPKKKPPLQATPDVRKELDQAQAELASGAAGRALKRLDQVILKHPNTDVADDAYMLKGKTLYNARDFQGSYRAFMGVINAEVFSPNEADALYWAASSLHKLGRFDEALSLTNKSIQMKGVSTALLLDNYRLRYKILNQLGDRLDALQTIIYLSNNETSEERKKSFRIKAIEFVESRLSDNELQTVVSERDYGFVRGYALFRLANLKFEQRDFRRARDFFSDVVTLMPDSDLSERAKNRIEQIDARRRVEPKTIGAILPLTGRHSHVAYRTLRGLQLGLGIYGRESSSFRLAVIDSEDNPDVARRGVERLVTEDHVIAIVGSLLSKTSVAVASKADELGVPTIALSQKSGLTEIGDHIYRNSLTSTMQVHHLVRIAMEELKLKRFAILYPNDAYGIEYANLFWDAVLARGGSITGAQAYKPKTTNFGEPVQRLVGTFFLEDRQDEYKTRLETWFKEKKRLRGRQSPPEDLLPPIVDFDAIFIPDSVRAIGQIAPTLAYYDISGVKLLGTNLWNTPSLIRRGEKYIDDAIFVDSLLVSDPEFMKTQFYRDYKSTFGEAPGLFEAQAYDAGMILRQIIAGGERSRVGVSRQLSQVEEFPGSTGILRMTEKREILRPLVTLTVHKSKITKLGQVPEAEVKKTKRVSK